MRVKSLQRFQDADGRSASLFDREATLPLETPCGPDAHAEIGDSANRQQTAECRYDHEDKTHGAVQISRPLKLRPLALA
jgi:hypothetical protein